MGIQHQDPIEEIKNGMVRNCLEIMTAMCLALFWFIYNRYRRPFTSASCKPKHGMLGPSEQRMRGGKLRIGGLETRKIWFVRDETTARWNTDR